MRLEERVAVSPISAKPDRYNGRDVFTANNGRTLSLEDVPSELLAGVDVRENPSANLLKGGIAGLTSLRACRIGAPLHG
jgi:hypothetical protein